MSDAVVPPCPGEGISLELRARIAELDALFDKLEVQRRSTKFVAGGHVMGPIADLQQSCTQCDLRWGPMDELLNLPLPPCSAK